MISEFLTVCVALACGIGEYLDRVKYINKDGTEVQTCMQNFFVDLHRVVTAPGNKQIGYSCCYYLDFVECSKKRQKSNYDLPAAVEFFNLVIGKVIGEALNVLCGKNKNGSGACEALPALSKQNDSNARGKGFVGPLITIGETIG